MPGMQVIDETEADLSRLIAADFGPNANTRDFEILVLNWLHYQARRIPVRPRRMIYSARIDLLRATYHSIDLIARDLNRGSDMTPWLSDRIRSQKDRHKADLMFNDWQIVHFHTNQLFVSPTKTKRDGPLLFARIEADTAYLLDVLPHGSWTESSLLETLLDVAPETMAKFEIKGLLAPTAHYSDEDRLKLRKAGLSYMIGLRGRTYMPPGMGVSSSGHASRLVHRLQQLRRSILSVRRQIEGNTMQPGLRRAVTQQLGLPVRLGISHFCGVLQLFDKNRGLVLTEFPCLE